MKVLYFMNQHARFADMNDAPNTLDVSNTFNDSQVTLNDVLSISILFNQHPS